MKIIYTINGIPLDSFTSEEQDRMKLKMISNAVKAIGYKFVEPLDIEKIIKRKYTLGNTF